MRIAPAVLQTLHSQQNQAKGKALLLTLSQNQRAKGPMLQLHSHQQQDLLEALQEGLAPYLQTLLTKMNCLLASPE